MSGLVINLQFRLKRRGWYRSCPVHRGQIEPGPSTVCLYYLIRRRLATTIKLTRPSAANPTSARLPGLARPVAMSSKIPVVGTTLVPVPTGNVGATTVGPFGVRVAVPGVTFAPAV